VGNSELSAESMGRIVVTEQNVIDAHRRGEKSIQIDGSALVTAAATDRASSLGISFVKSESPSSNQSTVQGAPSDPRALGSGTVALGSDHGGFQMKEMLKKYVGELGFRVIDVGTTSESSCDYPDFAYAVARLVSTGEAWRGVVVDGAGIGSAIVANKVPNVRAACCHNEFVARNSREHNDTNVLTLGSRVIGSEVAKEIVRVWLTTWFAGGRHKKRVDKINDVERRFLK
jgi:ribose 5-phosphate isomerase B